MRPTSPSTCSAGCATGCRSGRSWRGPLQRRITRPRGRGWGVVSMWAPARGWRRRRRPPPGPDGVTDLRPDDLTDAASDREEDEIAYGVSPETVQTAREALETKQGHVVREL